MMSAFQEKQVFNHSFTVSESVYSAFLSAFKDCNPLHVNDEFAQKKGFTSKVMHGNILNGFLSYFIGECLPVKNVIIHHQQIQFNNPVYLGDTLAFHAEVTNVAESVMAVEFKFQFRTPDNKIAAKGKIQIGLLP